MIEDGLEIEAIKLQKHEIMSIYVMICVSLIYGMHQMVLITNI